MQIACHVTGMFTSALSRKAHCDCTIGGLNMEHNMEVCKNFTNFTNAEHTFTWNDTEVNSDALHLLIYPCPCIPNDPLSSLDSPGAFFVQLSRFSLSICVIILLLALYNSVHVLGQNIMCVATCSIYWILMVTMVALKAVTLIVLVPVACKHSFFLINSAGFILITIIQSTLVYLLFLAIHHEMKFRSPDFASTDSPFRGRNCITATWDKLLCSWHRFVTLPIFLLPLILLVAIEIVFQIDNNHDAPVALIWSFVGTLILPRFVVMVTTVFLFRAKDNLRLTLAAKIHLCAALALSLLEEIPNSVFTLALQQNECDVCLLHDLTLYDFFQVFGGLSLLFYLLFVRSQYLRVEQECKLAIVWDQQKLLQVNGRKDVVFM